MRVRFDIRKYSAAEIALLAIFASGLLLASFVVAFQNRIRLSMPIEAKPVGLSVSLPVGAGWEGTQSWQLQRDGSLVLAAHLEVTSRPEAIVQWRYSSGAGSVALQKQLVQKARDAEAEVIDAGQIWGDVLIEWIHGRHQSGSIDIFLGMARLDQGHVVELQVKVLDNPDLAVRLFEMMARSIKFKP